MASTNVSRWIDNLPARKDGTTLCELQIPHVADAHELVGVRPHGNYTPVVLAPQSSSYWCCCICPVCVICIPHGFSAIVSSFGARLPYDTDDDSFDTDGTWPAGVHCVNPLVTVDKLVAKQYIVFDTPIRECKTKDNVSVNIDIMIVFRVKNGWQFVVNWGAEKFDDFLRASQDEVMRQMAMDKDVEEMYDLFGTNTNYIVEELNTKFSKQQVGVYVENLTVKKITLPAEMTKDFQEYTLYESKQRKSDGEQKFKTLKVDNEEGRKKLDEECINARMRAESEAEVTQSQAQRETQEVIANTQREISEIEANRLNEAMKIATNADLEAEKIKAQIMQVEQEYKSKTQAETSRLAIEAEAHCKKREIDASVDYAAKIANGKKALGEAEGESSAAFAARRRHEAALKKLDILEQLVMKQSMAIATSQENTAGLSADNSAVTQVGQQGLEALKAKLVEITATSMARVTQVKPPQLTMG